MGDIIFRGKTPEEQALYQEIFEDSLIIAAKDDEIKELRNLFEEIIDFTENNDFNNETKEKLLVILKKYDII